MPFKRIFVASLCLAVAAGAGSASAQRYPQRIIGSDGTPYLRLGPNTYGNYTGPSMTGPGAGGSGVDAYGRPIYRGVLGGNTTNTTGTQNPSGPGSYGAAQAQADAARSDASRRAGLDRFLQERAQIQAQRDAYLRSLRR